jgi:hypothetical protein
VRVDFPLTCRSVAESKSPGNPGWVSQAARNNATITPVVSADGLVVTYTVTFTGNYRSLQPAVSDPMCITPDPVVVVPTPTETPTDPNNPVIPIP